MSTFAQYATSTAFAVALTKRQCNAILRLADDAPRIWHGSGLTTHRSLAAKGLVFWHKDADGNPQSFGGLTEAGQVMAQLLKLAGLTVANTETPATLHPINQEAA